MMYPVVTLIREWASAGQAAAPGGAFAEPGFLGRGQAAAGWRLTVWPGASSSAIRRRVSRSGSPDRPSGAMDRSGILDRILSLASSARTGPRRSPPVSASIMARPDLAAMGEATESILMSAACGTLHSADQAATSHVATT